MKQELHICDRCGETIELVPEMVDLEHLYRRTEEYRHI